MNFHLEDTEANYPGDEARQGCLACPTHSYEQEMTLWLAEDTVNAQNVFQDLIKQHQWHVQLLLVEHLMMRYGGSQYKVRLKKNLSENLSFKLCFPNLAYSSSC